MLKAFEELKTPEELLAYMIANINYGYIGKNNRRLYVPKDVDFHSSFPEEYYLQTPEEFLISKHGVCWDSAELARYWFSKENHEFKMFFMTFVESKIKLTHTFLAYKKADSWYRFESVSSDNKGIHEFSNLNDLIATAKKEHINDAIKYRGATEADFNDLKICEYEKPVYGCSSHEFIMNIVIKAEEYKS